MINQFDQTHGAQDYSGAPWSYRHAVRDGLAVVPRWGIGDSIIGIVGSVVVSAVTLVALMTVHTDPSFGGGLLISLVLPWLALAGYPLLATHLKGNGPRVDLGLFVSKQHVRLGVVAGLGGLVLAAIVGQITVKILGPVTSTAGDLLNEQVGWTKVAFVICIVIGAPIVEEIAFRGLLFTSLCKSGVKPVVSVVVSALAFSVFHFEPQRLAILFAIGLVLGEIRRRSGSLVPSIVAHAVNNSPAILLLFGVTAQIGPFVWH